MASTLDFAQWKWDLVGLIGAFVLAAAQKGWRKYQQQRSETWPISYGQILVASVEEKKKATLLTLDYSYRVGGETYTGAFKKNFDSPAEAQTWAEALDNKQVAVRYDAGQPSRSQLPETDLEPTVRASAPFQAANLENAPELPGWERLLVSLGFLMALAGLTGTIVLWAGGIVGKRLLPAGSSSFLNAGGFVLLAFAGLLHWRDSKRQSRAAPEWMKYLGSALLYYAIFSVAIVPSQNSGRDHRPGAPAQQESHHGGDRYQLFLYFTALEWCYERLHAGRAEDDLQRSLQANQ
jgi:hypothetical protein